MTAFHVSVPFSQRACTFDGLHDHNSWRIKLYSVLYGEEPASGDTFTDGEELALAALPCPAISSGRPGLAVLIRHQGRGMNYVVLFWWDRENELPIHVFVDKGKGWRTAEGSESVCVWDLEIIWAERNAYVDHMLSNSHAPNFEAYLQTTAV